jgi:LuxR family quorum sensing-dependent transcriptional regulator
MVGPLLRDTFDTINSIEKARTSEQVSLLLIDLVRPYGAESLLCGVMPNMGVSQYQELRSHVLMERWPREWAERYFRLNYLADDPAIAGVKLSSGPFMWSALRERYADNPKSNRVMNEASEFGLAAGFTVPLQTLDDQKIGLSFAGPRIEMSPREQAAFNLLGTYAVGRVLALQAGQQPPVKLTPREREVLHWAAEGKTEWEIGAILGISEHGAEAHIRKLHRKLGATSRAQLVSQAIRCGLIQ